LANWIATLPEVRAGSADFTRICAQYRVAELRIDTQTLCSASGDRKLFPSLASLEDGRTLTVALQRSVELEAQEKQIDRSIHEYDQLAAGRKNIRKIYLLFLLLIALFILFVATWIALLLARQVSVPISALLVAASEVRKGNLGHRVQVKAID